MGTRSLFDQETQVHRSEAYVDNRAPSEANYETNATDLQYDLNSIRSMLHELRDTQDSNWWAALVAPSTFVGEGGAARGVQDVNEDLYDIERKRILRRRPVVGADVVVPSSASAVNGFNSTDVFTDGETVTIGSQTYTLKSPFVDAANNINASGTRAQTHENLRRAINGDGTEGTHYGTGTAVNANVTATDTATSTDVTAKVPGTVANAVATTTTCANATWETATLEGGAGDVVVLDGGAGELPGNTTAAVGAVTTRGTVVASVAGSFERAALTEVAGSSTIQPKNLCVVLDTATGDPILDVNGREVFALIQSEIATDGHTINTTTQRVQLSFVTRNATLDDLIIAPSAAAGKSIDYSPVERYAFEDIPEQAWLGEDFVDVGAGSATRQSAYDNQGITPVDLITNAILDLEGAGLYWRIRDNLEANLFTVTEGSAGGTSTIGFGGDVDVFDNNAVSNLFAGPLTVDDDGTDIEIGVTAGQINTTSTDDLELQAGGELYLDDGNRTGSTWATDGIKLSDTTAEWSSFESEFGEVSLLNAILQAKQTTERALQYANVITADIPANTLITGAGGGANISAQMPSYKGLTFVTDVEVYINGQRQRPGANSSADNDVYPSAVAGEQATGDFYCEYTLRYRGAAANADNICMVVWGQPTP